jgi:hypothetical protein
MTAFINRITTIRVTRTIINRMVASMNTTVEIIEGTHFREIEGKSHFPIY